MQTLPLATLKGHSGSVNGVAFSPDGKTIASGATNQKIILWDSRSGAQRATLSGHKAKIIGVAYSGDGKLIASLDEMGTIIVWDTASAKQQKTIRVVDKDYRGEAVSQRTNCMAFTSDGKRVAAGVEDKSVRIWDVDQGTIIVKIDNVEADGLAFSPDGRKIAAASHDNSVKVFRTAATNAPQLFTGHDRSVHSVDFMPIWEEWLGFPAMRMKNGRFPLPDKPGLGFELTEAALAKYPFAGTRPMARVFHADGSVAEW